MRPPSPRSQLSGTAPILVAMLLAGCGGSQVPTQPGPPDHLVFVVQPTPTPSGRPITPAVQVALVDASGKTVTTATDAVSLVLGTNPRQGALAGTTTVNAASGIASFANIRIDSP